MRRLTRNSLPAVGLLPASAVGSAELTYDLYNYFTKTLHTQVQYRSGNTRQGEAGLQVEDARNARVTLTLPESTGRSVMTADGFEPVGVMNGGVRPLYRQEQWR